ncbi:MAG: copper-binding protein [Thermoanaerobaculia bacterium]
MRNRRFLGALLLLAPLVACRAEVSPPQPASIYEVEGEIVRLPTAERPEIVLRHEAVPGFRDESGKVVGMDAMTMPFALGANVPLTGLAVGDAVRFTLEVRWSEDRQPVQITRIARSGQIRSIDLEDGKLPGPSAETPR